VLKVLNLGAGVQSTTVLLMSCEGVLPPLDCGIFADTGWEPKAVYRHLDWLESIAGVPIHRVSAGNIRDNGVNSTLGGRAKGRGERFATMPLFIINPDGTHGMIRRQCTQEFKIEPIEKFIKRDLLGLKPRQRAPKAPVVQQWFGISRDEFTRTRKPAAAWKTHYYPLVGVEFVGDKMVMREGPSLSRAGCLEWLAERRYPTPPRSACIGCPFHSEAEWRDMKENRAAEFEDACDFDERIRPSVGRRGTGYLHRSCKPLREVDFKNDFDKGQLPLFEIGGVARDECLGMCGA
jgi:hypothetical protein